MEIQNFEPQKMGRAYVYVKISEYPPPPPPPLGTMYANGWDSDQTPRRPNCVSISLTDEKGTCI